MKIALLHALQLGDLLCAIPALRALHAEYPVARTTLIGLPWAREFAARFRPYLYDFVEFPGYPGLPERSNDTARLPAFLDEARRRRFDLALQMHGSGEITNRFVMLLQARRTAGFYRRGQACPDPARFIEWHDGEHEVSRSLRLMAQLGIPARGAALEFPLYAEDWQRWKSLGLESGRYAVVHAGSQLASRRWPAARFAAVADALAAEGLEIVLTGTQAEATITHAVRSAMRSRSRVLDLAGLTSLGTLTAIVARARVLVANDTGVSHVAAAVRCPSVIVASGSDPRRWAPLDRELHRVLHHEVQCRPCAHASCPIGHPCALGVSVEQVLRQTQSLAACVA
jgi:ADP-heptose:LPS heptosyltransferase